MPRGNDAIPSWSGFNYQGKMLMLCIFEKINELIRSGNEAAISQYSVEIEKTEDFVFQQNDNPIAFYQVKASISKTKWKDYEEAIDKLIEHKNESLNVNADCFFVIAKSIKNWSDSPYYTGVKEAVKIYKYKGVKEVSLQDVGKSIIEEIDTYCKSRGRHNFDSQIVYGYLCMFLDEEIARMHLQSYETREYCIDFIRFIDEIEKALHHTQEHVEARIRERVYEHIVRSIEAALKNISKFECKKVCEDCDLKCPAKAACDNMLKISDYQCYCRILNPARTERWDDELSYVECFSEENIKHYIFRVFKNSKESQFVKGDTKKVGLECTSQAKVDSQTRNIYI